VPLIRITAGLPWPLQQRRREDALADAPGTRRGAVHARFLPLHPGPLSARSRRERTEHPFVSYKWSIVSMPHRSKQDFARLTDEALGTVMAPFPSWGPGRKKGQDRKYFYKSLLLICSSLLSRQMCARGELSPACRTHKGVRARARARASERASELCHRYTHARVLLFAVCNNACTGEAGPERGYRGASWHRRGAPHKHQRHRRRRRESIAAIGGKGRPRR